MSNPCFNDYYVKCETEQEAKNLCFFLTTHYKSNKLYIYDILKNASLPTNDVDGRESLNGGAEISDDGKTVHFNTESAWSPQPNTWNKICKQFSKNSQLLYYAEEPSNDLLATNDKNLLKKYFLDISYKKGKVDIYEYGLFDKEKAIKLLQKILRTKTSDIKLLMQKVEDTDFDDNTVSVHTLEFFDLNDWDR